MLVRRLFTHMVGTIAFHYHRNWNSTTTVKAFSQALLDRSRTVFPRFLILPQSETVWRQGSRTHGSLIIYSGQNISAKKPACSVSHLRGLTITEYLFMREIVALEP